MGPDLPICLAADWWVTRLHSHLQWNEFSLWILFDETRSFVVCNLNILWELQSRIIYLFSQVIAPSATKSSALENTSCVRLLCDLWKKKKKENYCCWTNVCVLVCSMCSNWLIGRQLATLFRKTEKEIFFFHCQKHGTWRIDFDFPSQTHLSIKSE